MLIYLQLIDNPADQIRFAGIYEKYKHIMYYVAKRILKDHQDSEDAVQDAYRDMSITLVILSMAITSFLIVHSFAEWIRCKELYR